MSHREREAERLMQAEEARDVGISLRRKSSPTREASISPVQDLGPQT